MRVRPSSSLATLTSVAFLMACGEPPPRSISPSPVPSIDWNGRLSGSVFETTSGVRRPISGARVLVTDVIEGYYGNYPPNDLLSDANGRFSIARLAVGRAVSVVATVGVFPPKFGLYQVCAVHPTITADTSVEVELVAPGAIPETFDSPIVSGVVFESSPEGRRPVADLSVSYVFGDGDGTDAYTLTDANGRYSFCRVPPGRGYLFVDCTKGFPIEIHGDATVDVEVMSSRSGCR